MNPDLKNWDPFKFLRKTGDRPATDEAANASAPKHWPPEWSEVSRLLSGDPWRAMGEFFHDPLAGVSGLERWFGDFSSSRFRPRIDVVNEGKALRITAELPGMDGGDLHASIEDGALVLRGEKKQDVRSEEDGCYRLERAYGAFMRTIPLPEGVDVDHVDAKFDKGVLTLSLPKTGASSSAVRKIDIR